MILNWSVTKEDMNLITAIAIRAVTLARRLGDRPKDYEQRDAIMDITAVHANGAPLDLRLLLAADDGNFGHDVFGIRRHLDRETGKLVNFTPRFHA